MKLSITLSWPGGLLAAGSGTGTLWLLLQGTSSGGQISVTGRPCGLFVPDFALNPAVANELYHVDWPNALFDRQPSYFAGSSATLSSSDFALGSSFTMSQVVILIGASLANPASDPWPSAAALVAPDTEMDGKPAITASGRNGGGYVYVRATTNGSARADRVYTAARFIFTASGTISTCSQLSGAATFTNFETHIVGCRIAGGSSDCTTTQRDFLDTGRPGYTPAGTVLSAAELAATATCADVRAALP